jgi:glutamate synthase domain-containing protein 1
MCGIAGVIATTPQGKKELGENLFKMLEALECRGPDSAGVAMYHEPKKGQTCVRVMLPPHAADDKAVAAKVRKALAKSGVKDFHQQGKNLRIVLGSKVQPKEIVALIESAAPGCEVLSLGEELEIIKQTGSPEALDKTFGLRKLTGSHAIGHTRLSTESRIDISHSQPFWAHGLPDIATVHNGHITNYHKLRRIYEEKGVKFYTENDSELLGVYLADQMGQGLSLRQVLEKSVKELDGSFCYLVATKDQMGYVKDSFCLKPLVVGKGKGFVAVATEEIALRQAFPDLEVASEPDGQSIQLWDAHA